MKKKSDRLDLVLKELERLSLQEVNSDKWHGSMSIAITRSMIEYILNSLKPKARDIGWECVEGLLEIKRDNELNNYFSDRLGEEKVNYNDVKLLKEADERLRAAPLSGNIRNCL